MTFPLQHQSVSMASLADVRHCLAQVVNNARQTIPKGAFIRIRLEACIADVVVAIDPNDYHVVVRMLSIIPTKAHMHARVVDMTQEIMDRLLWVVCTERTDRSRDDGHTHPHTPLLEVDCSGNDHLRKVCMDMHKESDSSCGEGTPHDDTRQQLTPNLLIYACDIDTRPQNK